MKEQVHGHGYAHGLAFGLLGSMDFELLRFGNSQLLLSPGVGLSYITETIRTQPETKTVGSHLNILLNNKLGICVPASDRVDVVLSADLTHHSNGGIKIPNGGVNTIAVAIGLKYRLPETEPKGGTSKFMEAISNTGGSYELAIGFGRRGRYRSDGGFWRNGLYTGYNYYINPVIGFKAGVDMVYHFTTFDAENRETFQHYGSSYDQVRLGVSTGMEFAVGRMVINGMGGRYIHFNSLYEDIKWYWTANFRYFITPRFALQSSLYMHYAQADYLNWGVVLKR